jgi:hypothetical protein
VIDANPHQRTTKEKEMREKRPRPRWPQFAWWDEKLPMILGASLVGSIFGFMLSGFVSEILHTNSPAILIASVAFCTAVLCAIAEDWKFCPKGGLHAWEGEERPGPVTCTKCGRVDRRGY